MYHVGDSRSAGRDTMDRDKKRAAIVISKGGYLQKHVYGSNLIGQDLLFQCIRIQEGKGSRFVTNNVYGPWWGEGIRQTCNSVSHLSFVTGRI